MIFFSLKRGQDMENRAAHPHQEPEGMKTLLSSLNSVRCELSEVQWNPALRPPGYYGHFFSGGPANCPHIFLQKRRTFVNAVTR